MLRQTIMVLVVGLIVARPLVYGGDPGLLGGGTTPTSLVLTVLWLVAAAAWAVWRIWARQHDLFAGIVEATLGGVVILVFATAHGVAAYQHPARLVSWEWLAMLVALFLVRQLFAGIEDQHGLLAVLLASVVSLSAFGLYQTYYSLPRDRARYPTVEAVLQDETLWRAGLVRSKDDPETIAFFERLQSQQHAFATFAHPNSFASYLVLLLPALAGAAYFAYRGPYRPWQKFVGCLFLAMGAWALWCTHSRGGLLAVAVAGGGLAAVVFRRALWSHKVATLAGAVLLVAAAAGAYLTGLPDTLLGKQQATAALRGEYWRATWHMIQERPWFGFGPGNFGRVYPRFMPETAGETIADPHNFALEIWATSGIVALAALVVALAAFFARVFRSAITTPVQPEPDPPPQLAGPDELLPLRWAYYLGAVFGMLLAFVLVASYVTPDQITEEALIAGGQSILWFMAFAFFEQIRWTPHGRALALTAGVAGMLLNLCVSGGISYPQVAGLLWIVIGLALTVFRPMPVPWLSRKAVVGYVLVPLSVAAALTYLLGIMLPVTTTKQALASHQTVDKRIQTLEEATKTDMSPDSDVYQSLADLYAARWADAMFRVPRDDNKASELMKTTVDYAQKAQACDPNGQAGFVGEYEIRKNFAKTYQMLESERQQAPLRRLLGSGTLEMAVGGTFRTVQRYPLMLVTHWHTPDELANSPAVQFALGCNAAALPHSPVLWRMPPWDNLPALSPRSSFLNYKEQYRLAADAVLRFLPSDPNNPRLHSSIADALYHAEDRPDLAAEHARRALELDYEQTYAPRKLTAPQRKYLQQRLGIRPES